MKIAIKAEPRSIKGTGASRRLRRESKVPGILYGAGKDAQSIEVDHKELWFKLRTEAFHASILDMEIGTEKTQVLLRVIKATLSVPSSCHVDSSASTRQEDPCEGAAATSRSEVSPGVRRGRAGAKSLNELGSPCRPEGPPEFSRATLEAPGRPRCNCRGEDAPGVEAIVTKGATDPRWPTS